jgi:hypothetical protein
MAKSLILITVLTLLVSCRTSVGTFQTSDTNKIGVKSNKFRGTIFKSSYSTMFLTTTSDTLKRFTPTEEDIILAETILKEQIGKINTLHINQLERRQNIDKNLNKYFRQYVGFVNEQGNRVVHINLSWDRFTIFDRIKGYWDSRLEFTSDYSMTLDGGSHFWNVNVDITSKTLYGLSVNGIA